MNQNNPSCQSYDEEHFHINTELKARLLELDQEKEQFLETEKELDNLIAKIEQKKRDLCMEPSYSQFAYVTS